MRNLWAVLAGVMLAMAAMISTGLAENPTKLKIAGILSAGKEAPWETSFVTSMDRIIAAKPHGLDIEVNYTENVYDNAEQVFRTYAETGVDFISVGALTHSAPAVDMSLRIVSA